jgi:hypothetical protein
MASPKLGARRLAVLAMAPLALAVGCYSTTPHRAEVASSATAHDCGAVIADVFARSGFIELPTPPNLTMFFAARTTGPYSSFLSTGAGVGVTLQQRDQDACHVTLEALSPDASCPGTQGGLSGTLNCRQLNAPGTPALAAPGYGVSSEPPCPVVGPPICELTSAPGRSNDAAVDELARRVQIALGGGAHVNQLPTP